MPLQPYTDEEFSEQNERIRILIAQKTVLLNDNRAEELDMEAALNYCFRFITSAVDTWIESDYLTRIRFQKMIFKEKIPFDGKEFGNTNLALVYKLIRQSTGEKSALVAPIGAYFEPGVGFSRSSQNNSNAKVFSLRKNRHCHPKQLCHPCKVA